MRFDAEARIAQRGVLWRLLAVDILLLVSAGFVTGWRLRLVPSLFILGLFAYALMGAFRTPKKPRSTLHAVEADATGLTVDGKQVMTRAEIASAYCVPTGDDGLHAVHVDGRPLRRSFVVYVDSMEKGAALLSALQIDPSMSTAHFRALPPWAKHVRWLAVVLTASPWVLINVLRVLPGWGMGLVAALYGVIALPLILPQRVDVGHDGVFLRWLGNKRFIPFSQVEGATLTRLGVTLALRGGQSLELRLSQKDGGADTQARALLGRITDALAAQADASHADEEAHLARGMRDLETWMREMRALGTGELSGYRAQAMPRERLWAVVENPTADHSAREGAALALSASLDEEDRARILALAHRTASPRLRIALDGVGRERDEARLRVTIEAAEREYEELEASPSDSPRAARVRRRAD
jgi:hypothetical protein